MRPASMRPALMRPAVMRPAVRRSASRAAAAAAALVLAAPAAAQSGAPPAAVGRWDLRVTGPDGAYPSWFEVTASGRSLVGRFVGRVGSARPVGRVDVAGDTLRFAVPPQYEPGAGELRVEAAVSGDQLAGTLVTPAGERHPFTGARAPALRRDAAPRWGAPVALFNGRDLAGWTPVGGGENRWRAANGVLASSGSGANLATTRRFDDFRLHLEFRLPRGSNSGVYLRGRYEVQIEDDEAAAGTRHTADPDAHQLGAVYGFVAPTAYAGRGPGQWQTYDITLVGRRVTVVLNGRTVVADQPVPGVTGGALDSDEGAPGPILLQGDHGAVEYRNVVITPAAAGAPR